MAFQLPYLALGTQDDLSENRYGVRRFGWHKTRFVSLKVLLDFIQTSGIWIGLRHSARGFPIGPLILVVLHLLFYFLVRLTLPKGFLQFNWAFGGLILSRLSAVS